MKTGRMRRLKSICVLLSLIVLVIGGGRSPTTVMAEDTKIVEAIGSGPCWSSSGSWNSWKSWFTGKGYTINGSGKTTLWWNKKDHEAWWLGVQDKNGNQKWALLFDGVQTTSGNYITRYNGWMPVREENDIVWYYLDSEGLTYTNTWLHTRCVDANYKSSDKHGYFYFDKNGRLQTGWFQDSNGRWYYSDGKDGSVNPGISEHGGLAWTVIKNPTSYEKDGLYSNGLYYLSGLNAVTNVYRMNTNGTYDYVGNTVNNIKVGDGDNQINPLKEKTINADTDYVNKQIYNSKGLFINTNAEGSCTQQQNLALKNDDYKQIKVNEFTYYIDRKKFTLTQNINSDTETTKTSSIYFEGTTTIENPFAKTGYTFATWDLQGNGSKLNDRTFVMGDEDAVLTAQWTPVNYSISYSLNGGSLSGQKTSYDIETANFTLPTPLKSGYTFTGWTGTGLSSATKSVTVSKGSTGNRSYTANWSTSDYTVSFNYNKPSTATGTMSGNRTTSKGVTYAAAYGTLPQPSIPGWTFNGWYTAASGGSKISATTTYTAAGNQTLYAHWTMNTYSISYNANGGSLSGQKTSYNVNTDSFTLPTPTKNGYTFTGWMGSNGTTAQKSVTITKGSTGNKSYAANWTPNVLTVKYHNDGGSSWNPKGAPIDVTNKDVLDIEVLEYDLIRNSYNLYNASHLTKKGYHSSGYWFVGSKSSSVRISDSKYFLKAQDLAQEAGVLDALQKGNVTIDLYPDMSPNTYTLTFDYGKKSVTTAKLKTITYDSVYGALPNPQCAGWTFKGWNTKADGTGDVVTEKTMCKDLGDVTVYAQWTYNPVNVKVPQVLTGDLKGNSQFRVKCDNFKAGNIKVAVPNSFPYKQTGKADVTATITAKSGNNTITPTNKVCVYNITTRNGLSAGYWSGSFNIGLTLTKE